MEISLPVPQPFRDVRNSILVLKHPDLDCEQTQDGFLIKGEIKYVIPNKPGYHDGRNYYMVHPETGVPYGERVSSSVGSARLWLEAMPFLNLELEWLGFLVRGWTSSDHERRLDVTAKHDHRDLFTVLYTG